MRRKLLQWKPLLTICSTMYINCKTTLYSLTIKKPHKHSEYPFNIIKHLVDLIHVLLFGESYIAMYVSLAHHYRIVWGRLLWENLTRYRNGRYERTKCKLDLKKNTYSHTISNGIFWFKAKLHLRFSILWPKLFAECEEWCWREDFKYKKNYIDTFAPVIDRF